MAWSVALEGTTDCAAAMVMRESMHHDAYLAKAIVLQTERKKLVGWRNSARIAG